MDSIHRRHARGPLVPALVLIALGVVFFLTENHIVEAWDIWKFWPLVLVIAGVAKVSLRSPGRQVEGWVLIGVGLLFLASSLGLLRIAPHLLWPAILIGVGVTLLFRALPYSSEPSDVQLRAPSEGENFTMFGGAELNMSGQEFQGTAITAVFGGYNLDLRKSIMKSDRAIVEATAVFGGIELRVPATWNVVMQGAPIFGGYSDETLHPEPASNAPQLIIRGAAVFGGIAVKN
jgi:predicted membrane protein